jgi:hypothetical protein
MSDPTPTRSSGTWAALGGGCLMGLILGIILGALVQLYVPGVLGWLLNP